MNYRIFVYVLLTFMFSIVNCACIYASTTAKQCEQYTSQNKVPTSLVAFDLKRYNHCIYLINKDCPYLLPVSAFGTRNKKCVFNHFKHNKYCAQANMLNNKMVIWPLTLTEIKQYNNLIVITRTSGADDIQMQNILTSHGKILSTYGDPPKELLRWLKQQKILTVPLSNITYLNTYTPKYIKLANGEQRLVFRMQMQNGCVACTTNIYIDWAFDFTATGDFLQKKFLNAFRCKDIMCADKPNCCRKLSIPK